jgi:outer membrane protein assembly factor BamD (BamD/ComL family)/Tfp pilus assembly protein PilF
MSNVFNLSYKINLLNTVTVILLLVTSSAWAQDQQEILIANEYLTKGEKNKALEAYRTLAKSQTNIAAIHSNYFNLMLDMSLYNQAEDYIEKQIKKEGRLNYFVDLGMVYMKAGDQSKAEKHYKALFRANADDFYKMKSISDQLSSYRQFPFATEALLTARNAQGNPNLFALELANLFRMQSKRPEMVNEYLNYITQTPSNSTYIKNLLQLLLTKPEELDALERALVERVQQNPKSEIFSDLLVWVNLQQKNFYGAFIQARAFDKKFKKDQSKTLEIAQIALSNHDYENAIKAFSFVVKEYVNTENFLPAQLGIIKAREARVKESYPINRDSVKYLVQEYKQFGKRYAGQNLEGDAIYNASLLSAYYLHDLDSAVASLNKLIVNNRLSFQLKAQAKMSLGDIYLLKNEPWESTLLYSQVEKSQHETPIGYEAKLRNAKLWYYQGDFKLALEHLDILKQATTREIANDALDLSVRIKENTAFDSLSLDLKQFAHIELLLFQEQIAEATRQLDFLQKNRVLMKQSDALRFGFIETNTKVETEGDDIWVSLPTKNVNHSLLDDIYWMKAKLFLKKGKFEESIQQCQNILDQFGSDVLADDAYFMQADIYEHQLKNTAKAMELYRDFLSKFPGSVYVAEARKRFRVLRGDFTDITNP